MNGPEQIKHPLISGDFTEAHEPFGLFAAWFAEAVKSEPNDPNAMALATVDSGGLPDVRMVLLKGYDTEGFVFYSHIDSAKGRELAANPKAAILFHWKSLRRQIRVRGTVTLAVSAWMGPTAGRSEEGNDLSKDCSEGPIVQRRIDQPPEVMAERHGGDSCRYFDA